MGEKIAQEEFNIILDDHLIWLSNDSREVRGRGKRANLSGKDLRNLDLKEVNLAKAILARTNLEGMDLSYANFSSSDLTRSNLNGTNLKGADLSSAYLNDARFNSANLYFTNLTKADLSGADLRGATLIYTRLDRANYPEVFIDDATIIKETFPSGDFIDVYGLGEFGERVLYSIKYNWVWCEAYSLWKGGTLANFANWVEDTYGLEGETTNVTYYTQYMYVIGYFSKAT